MNTRVYKGVVIYGKRGEWYCDLFVFPSKHPFKTLKDCKSFIKSWKDK